MAPGGLSHPRGGLPWSHGLTTRPSSARSASVKTMGSCQRSVTVSSPWNQSPMNQRPVNLPTAYPATPGTASPPGTSQRLSDHLSHEHPISLPEPPKGHPALLEQ